VMARIKWKAREEIEAEKNKPEEPTERERVEARYMELEQRVMKLEQRVMKLEAQLNSREGG